MSRSPTRVQLFATREDILEVITAVEATTPLTYVLAGLFDDHDVSTFESLIPLPGLGTAPFGSSVRSPRYLVAARPFVPVVRAVPQYGGGTKYAVDQLENPTTIVICPGGLFEDHSLIAGNAGTASKHPASLGLFRIFLAEIRRHYAQIRAYRVGGGAARLLDSGARLTADVRSPALYDLSRQ